MVAIMTVFELPPRESWSNRVNWELRYGMWVLFPSTSADMTLPRVDRDRLIFTISLNRAPSTPVLDCLSEPWHGKRKKEKKCNGP